MSKNCFRSLRDNFNEEDPDDVDAVEDKLVQVDVYVLDMKTLRTTAISKRLMQYK